MKPLVQCPIIAIASVANLYARDETPVSEDKKKAELVCFQQQLQMIEIKKELQEMEKKQETAEFLKKIQASKNLYVPWLFFARVFIW